MVFAYARDNLGTDFTMFLYLTALILLLCLMLVLRIFHFYCFFFKRREYMAVTQGQLERELQSMM